MENHITEVYLYIYQNEFKRFITSHTRMQAAPCLLRGF